MPRTTIPLVGELTARGAAKSVGTSAKDQQFINCLFEVANNPQLGSKNVYCIKRTGIETGTDFGVSIKPVRGYSSYFGTLFQTIAGTGIYNAAATKLGDVSDTASIISLSDTVANGQDLVFFVDGGGIAWFIFKDAVTTNFPTFSGDTHTNTTIDNIASTTGLYRGQLLSGTGIQAGTRISSVDSATAITVDTATTGTATVTITKEAIAKVTDADVPTFAPLAYDALDGYCFAGTSAGKIYNCDINTPWSWGASNYISADYSSDGLLNIFKLRNFLVSSGNSSIQAFEITGNPSGSILSRVKQASLIGPAYNRPIYHTDGNAYCIGATANGGTGIFRIEGVNAFVPVTDDITQQVMQDNGYTVIGSATCGNKNILLATTNSSNCIAFDPSNSMSSIFSFSGNTRNSFKSYIRIVTGTTIFTWATGNTWQDAGASYTMTIQTEPKILNKGHGFFIRSIDVIADTQSSGSGTLSISTDDYASFPASFTIDWTKHLKRCWPRMTARSGHMIVKLTDAGNNAWRGSALVVDWEPCDI